MPIIRQRPYQATIHLQSAALFARLSAKFEKAYVGKELWEELYAEHKAYVTGAILTAVAFLEATINELFSDAAEKRHNLIKELNGETRLLIANMWEIDHFKQARILEKFQVALKLAQKQPFVEGESPYQGVSDLIQFRNTLVHYKPDWLTVETINEPKPKNQTNLEKLKERLRNKFLSSPLKGDDFFPNKYLSHGCAEWAVTSSLEFGDDFFSRMALPPRWNDIRGRLNTK